MRCSFSAMRNETEDYKKEKALGPPLCSSGSSFSYHYDTTMTQIVKCYLESLRISPFFLMISKRFTSLFCANLSSSSSMHFSSEILILLKSKMMFSACSLALLKLFSIVLLLLPLGLLISYETPSIMMSGVCTFGLFRGAINSISYPKPAR